MNRPALTVVTTLLAGVSISLATLSGAEADDPRIEILQLRLDGRPDEAIARAERLRHRQPEAAESLGIELVIGAAYEQQGLWHDAFDAYQRALSSTTPLHQRYATAAAARLHLRLERPDSATSFARRGLEERPSWAGDLVSTLIEAVRVTRDCAQLEVEPAWRLESDDRRRMRLAQAECRLDQRLDESVAELGGLVIAEQQDLVASEAAVLLWPHRDQLGDTALRALAATLHHHRLFDRSTVLYTELLGRRESAGDRYKLARGRFWLGDYDAAAGEFQRCAALSSRSSEIARAWYQRGRSLELAGRADAALVAFRRAYDAAPTGSWAAASLLSALRLEVLAERDDEAGRLYRLLTSQGSWRGLTDRAALFLASSDIARGRGDRARGWLSRSNAPEFRYWKGRLAELNGAPDEAVDHYLQLSDDELHPLASWARSRLQGDLAEATREKASRTADSGGIDALKRRLMLGGEDTADALRARMSQEAEAVVGELWRLEPAPVASWPLWSGQMTGEDALLQLGLAPSSARVRRWFPVDEPALAVAGIDLLYLNGQHRPGLRTAEILVRRLRPRLAAAQGLLPRWLLVRLYPRPYWSEIHIRARDFGVDPDLLLGLIRQESRFDPEAVSAVSARGLAQFVVATADDAAARAQIPELTAPMLHRPEVAIRLAAAHLGQLSEDLGRLEPAILAGYNAGLPQAMLWADYTFGDDPAEHYSKVGFTQTRDYIAKVLENRNHYRRLYRSALPSP